MKKLMLLTALCVLSGAHLQAQSWKETLKKIATEAVDQAADGKLTGYALAGTWNYTAPGVRFEGDDIASEIGGAALESSVRKQLEKGYARAGIRPGSATFTFEQADSTFSAVLGAHRLEGTYSFDPATHLITLHFAKGRLDLGSVPGYAYLSGSELQLLFPVTRLVELVTRLGSKLSTLSTATALLSRYENVSIGFAFSK